MDTSFQNKVIYTSVSNFNILTRGLFSVGSKKIKELFFLFSYRDLQPYRNQFATELAFNSKNKTLTIIDSQIVKDNVRGGIKSLHPH